MEKPEFKERLKNVKEKLPKYYNVVLRNQRPDLKATDVYNVIGKGTYNEKVLFALEEVFILNKVG